MPVHSHAFETVPKCVGVLNGFDFFSVLPQTQELSARRKVRVQGKGGTTFLSWDP